MKHPHDPTNTAPGHSGGMHKNFPRGVNGVLTGSPPMTQFMPTELIRTAPSLQYRPGSYFLGVVDGEVRMARAKDGRLLRWVKGGRPIGLITDKHIITIAPTRSDKGRACVNTNALLYPGSMLMTSAKPDIIEATLKHRAEVLGQECRFIAPFHHLPELEQHRIGFNPMLDLLPTSPTLVEDCDQIAGDLVVSDSRNEPHWNDKARLFLGKGVILHVATWPDFEKRRHLVTVYHLLMGDMQDLRDEMESNKIAGGTVMDAARDFFGMPADERGSVLSSLRRHLGILAYPQIQKVFTDPGPVDLSDLKRTNKTVYVVIPAMRLGTCGRLFRLFTNRLLAHIEKDTHRPEFPVRLVLDEFAAFGRMSEMETAVGAIAGLDCQLHIVLQDLLQLEAIYEKRAHSFLANAGVLQSFAGNDPTTLKYVSERLGTTSILTPTLGGVSADTETSLQPSSWRYQTEPLMTPAELGLYFGQQDELLRQLIIVAGLQPLALQRAYYDKHELFKN